MVIIAFLFIISHVRRIFKRKLLNFTVLCMNKINKLTWNEEEERRLGCEDKDRVDTAFGKCDSDP